MATSASTGGNYGERWYSSRAPVSFRTGSAPRTPGEVRVLAMSRSTLLLVVRSSSGVETVDLTRFS
jgi:hypothetical protein